MSGEAARGVTVFGCEQDEAELFNELAPRFGIVPTIIGAAASEWTSIPELGNRCISVGHKSELTKPTLRALKAAGVEYICTRSIGFDHIDLDAAASLSMTVENIVYAPDGVADFTLLLILMVIRSVTQVLRAAAGHDFRTANMRGADLRDLTVGVVGVGNIGTAVVRRLQGFGCRVLAYNNGRSTAVTTAAAEFVALDDLLRQSDIVTLHMPLNADTRHFIGRAQLELMKQGGFLVNTGRGALIDTGALIAALECGKLGGAALDVLEGEERIFYSDCSTTDVDNRFLLRLQQLPNAIVTPHVAYYTKRMLRDVVEGTLARCLTFERRRAHAETQGRDLVRGMLGGA